MYWTHQFPPLFWYPVDTGYGLHEYVVRDSGLGDPDGAKEVDPFSMHGLFESTTLVGA